MKFSPIDILKGRSFYVLQDDVALLKGPISRRDVMNMKAWLRSLAIGEMAGTLLMDSVGGISDSELLVSIVRVPLHIHVLKSAESFAALMLLCASHKTCREDSKVMVHATRWKHTKSARDVARDQKILDSHNFKTMSIMGSVLPSGDAKDTISKGMCSDTEIYIDLERLYDTGAIDDIGVFMPNMKCEYTREWLERNYND